MRLYICSNSAPALLRGPGGRLRAAVAGGLVPHLLALLDAYGGEWFFPQSPAAAAGWPRTAGKAAVHAVPLADELRTPHYQTVSIGTLLWLFHYLHETDSSPAFDAGLHDAWTAYREVNAVFAECLASASAAATGEDAVVLVNDYHFLLVPGEISRAGIPAGTRIVYAHQVPWCEPDYFGILPATIRAQILTSLLSCDTIVFHSRRWLEAFARCCDRYVPGATVRDEVIEYGGKAARLRAVPFPLDTAAVLDLQGAEATRRWSQHFTALAQGRRLLVRVDRLDLWKNHLRGLAAFGELLARHPRLSDEVCFLTVSAPVRYQTARHRAYEAACQAWATRINQASAGRAAPVALPDPASPDESRHRALAALSQAAAVLINPTYDGFNLVAKEATLVSEGAAVLLSRNAGAYEHLAQAVTPLEPFDVTGTADALDAALVGGVRASPACASAVRHRVRRDDTVEWLAAALGEESTDAR